MSIPVMKSPYEKPEDCVGRLNDDGTISWANKDVKREYINKITYQDVQPNISYAHNTATDEFFVISINLTPIFDK